MCPNDTLVWRGGQCSWQGVSSFNQICKNLLILMTHVLEYGYASNRVGKSYWRMIQLYGDCYSNCEISIWIYIYIYILNMLSARCWHQIFRGKFIIRRWSANRRGKGSWGKGLHNSWGESCLRNELYFCFSQYKTTDKRRLVWCETAS